MFCKYCGSSVDDNAEVCPNCDKVLTEPAAEDAKEKKEPGPFAKEMGETFSIKIEKEKRKDYIFTADVYIYVAAIILVMLATFFRDVNLTARVAPFVLSLICAFLALGMAIFGFIKECCNKPSGKSLWFVIKLLFMIALVLYFIVCIVYLARVVYLTY